MERLYRGYRHRIFNFHQMSNDLKDPRLLREVGDLNYLKIDWRGIMTANINPVQVETYSFSIAQTQVFKMDGV